MTMRPRRGHHLRLAALPAPHPGGRRPARRITRFLVAGVVLVTAALSPSSAAAGSRDLLPDLRMDLPDHLYVCDAPSSIGFQTEDCPSETPSSGRWLRFDSVLMNVGVGTFRVKASRPSTASPVMKAVQWIRQNDGTWRQVKRDATVAWGQEEDGHPHWHTQGMERYQILKLASPFPGGAKVGVKHGYCFFDGLRLRPDLPNARRSAIYSFYDCGYPSQSQGLLKLRVGLSVGWGDSYPWNFAGQRIDVTNVPDGIYLLCLTADPANEFVELRESNNQSWAKFRLDTVTNPGFRVDVTVLARGRTPCQTQVPYPIDPIARLS